MLPLCSETYFHTIHKECKRNVSKVVLGKTIILLMVDYKKKKKKKCIQIHKECDITLSSKKRVLSCQRDNTL